MSCQCDSDDDACGQANMFAYNYTNAQDTIVLATYNITNDVWTRVSGVTIIIVQVMYLSFTSMRNRDATTVLLMHLCSMLLSGEE